MHHRFCGSPGFAYRPMYSVRPVFNCSLKIGNAPSLNEAAYVGINLMRDIVKLSLYFRSNDTVQLSDIKQAFL